MKVFNKSLLIDGNNIYFDESYIVNKTKIDLIHERMLLSSGGVRLNAIDLGEDIINNFIHDKQLFNYINEYFLSDSCPMNISVIKEGKIYNYYLYKKNLIETIDNLIKSDKLFLSNEGLKNIKSLTNAIGIEKLKEELNNRTFTLKVNDKYVNCPYNLIINFLEFNDTDFYIFFDNDNNYNGISKPLFLHMINEFYKQYSEGYLFDSKVKDKINYINKQTDIEFIVFKNKFISNSDEKYKNIDIDKDLKNRIIKNIPENLSKLENIIYIYIKLCKELNYDLEYYAVRQKGPIADAHKDISKVKDINLKNNNVVCYEFNAIFAHFLNELNIDFEIRQHGENYGDTHAWLRVNIDNLLISFDSMHRIFWEFDLLQAKINYPLKGIKLYNKNRIVNDKFNKTIEKVYRSVIKEYNKDDDLKTEDLFDIIKDKDMSSDDKIKLMVEKVEKTNLSDMESIAYLLNLHKYSLIDDNNQKIEKEILIKKIGNELKLCILFTTYNKYLNEEDRVYNYYLYIPSEPLRRYDNDTLKFYLDNGIFEIYDKDRDIIIPGVDFISKKEIDLNIGRIR